MSLLYVLFMLSLCLVDANVENHQNSCPKRDKDIPEKPNIIIIIADDLGYGDLASYGHPIQEYGGIDKMASEGLKFTSFYSADSLCTPSRAGLLTGRLPVRTGFTGGVRVLTPNDTGGMPQNETTLPEALKSLGYKTGMVGKWHLGINAVNYSDGEHLPSKHGFDFVGYNLPFTNTWNCDETGQFMKQGPDPAQCFLYRGDKIVQQPFSHEHLTHHLLEDFNKFIDEQNDKHPFFFYFSFPQVHTDIFSSMKFQNTSKRGMFGDCMNEMNWAVEEIFDVLKSKHFDEKTLVIFLSDHGPHRELCELGGVTAGLKGGKWNSFEGGFRIPFIVRWPKVVHEGQMSHVPLSTLDLFPTLFCLAGGKTLPQNRIYDGTYITDFLLGRTNKQESEVLDDRLIFFYCNQTLMAVRYRDLKFHFATTALETDEQTQLICPHGMPWMETYAAHSCLDDQITHHDPPLVYNLNYDPFELYPLDFNSVNQEWQAVQIKVAQFKASLVIASPQLGHTDDNVMPCCNFPDCNCNYP